MLSRVILIPLLVDVSILRQEIVIVGSVALESHTSYTPLTKEVDYE
jgi:hypothetical protein